MQHGNGAGHANPFDPLDSCSEEVLLAHQEQLAACMEQLESFQAVQRSLLLVTDKATDPKAARPAKNSRVTWGQMC